MTDETGAPIPDWFHAAGGVSGTAPGQTAKATMNLAAGTYAMIDNANGQAPGPSNAARGALAEFEVTAGEDGALPPSTATITGATDAQAKPEHSFEIEGDLRVGNNRLRFVNEGEELHHAIMFPDQSGQVARRRHEGILRGGSAVRTAAGRFRGRGRDGRHRRGHGVRHRCRHPQARQYAVVCFLTNRDGKGKEHLAEGMIDEVVVK